jgi:hypothetical protein
VDEPKEIIIALRNLQSIVDVLSWIASRFDKAIDTIERQQSQDDILRELGEYLTGSIDRIDRVLLLLLKRLDHPKLSDRDRRETAELEIDTLHNQIHSLKIQKKRHQSNLNYLEEQAAIYGPSVTLEIKNKIEWTKAEIVELDQRIRELEQVEK